MCNLLVCLLLLCTALAANSQSPPQTPTNFHAERVSPTTIRLTWDYPFTDPIVEFRIWRLDSGAAAYPTAEERSFLDDGSAFGNVPPIDDKTWTYRIAAYDGMYNSDAAEVAIDTSGRDTVTVPYPDLWFSAASAPEAVKPGEEYSVSFTVENRGLMETGTGFEVHAYISRDQTLDTSDVRIDRGPRQIEPMPSNNTTSKGIDVTIPDLSPGTYYILLNVDPENQVDEGDDGRGNNVTAIRVNVIDDRTDIEALGWGVLKVMLRRSR